MLSIKFRSQEMREADKPIQQMYLTVFGSQIVGGTFDDLVAGDVPMEVMEQWFIKGWKAKEVFNE